jgi:hypothetical protein
VGSELKERAIAARVHLEAHDLAKGSEGLADGRLVKAGHPAETEGAVVLSGSRRDLFVLQDGGPNSRGVEIAHHLDGTLKGDLLSGVPWLLIHAGEIPKARLQVGILHQRLSNDGEARPAWIAVRLREPSVRKDGDAPLATADELDRLFRAQQRRGLFAELSACAFERLELLTRL